MADSHCLRRSSTRESKEGLLGPPSFPAVPSSPLCKLPCAVGVTGMLWVIRPGLRAGLLGCSSEGRLVVVGAVPGLVCGAGAETGGGGSTGAAGAAEADLKAEAAAPEEYNVDGVAEEAAMLLGRCSRRSGGSQDAAGIL